MTTEEKIKVMQGFIDGKKIEISSLRNDDWFDFLLDEPAWNWETNRYRIKEEPKYIPYSYEDDLLGMKVESKEFSDKFLITYQNNKKVWIEGSFCTYQELLDRYKKLDGTPCGKLAE